MNKVKDKVIREVHKVKAEEIHGHTYPTPNLILDQIDQQVPIPICPPTFVPFCLSIQNAIMQKHY